jgi:Bacteriophage HK97-gp10, putative tail-component
MVDMTTRIVMNSAGIVQVLKSSGVRAALQARARTVEGAARQIAPVSTGAYRDGITSWVEQHRDRVVVKIGSTDRKAAIVEASTGTMARSLRSSGVGSTRS